MNIFLKATIGVMVAVILCLTISKQDKTMALLLSLVVCAMVFISASSFWNQIINFIENLEEYGGLNQDYLKIILKAVGMALLSDVAVSICADAGNGSLGKVLQILTTAVIIWISLPLFTELISLANDILGEV